MTAPPTASAMSGVARVRFTLHPRSYRVTGSVGGCREVGDASVAGEHGLRVDLEPRHQHEGALVRHADAAG